jgi:hypothetical protein
VQNGAFHAWHEFHNSCIADVLDQPIDNGVTQIAVSHLPAAKAQAGLHLVSADEEADRLVLFGLVVVLIHGHGELDLLDRNHLLFLFGGPFALFFLVEETAVVLDAADRGNRVSRNLD